MAAELTARAKGALAERMVPVAADLACAVRDEGPAAIGELLDGFTLQELYGLAVVLAGMVPVDQAVGDLLAWVPQEVQCAPEIREEKQSARELLPCGTRAAYARHLRAKEKPCQPCRTAESDYRAAKRASAKSDRGEGEAA
jgi:hypothetical protein